MQPSGICLAKGLIPPNEWIHRSVCKKNFTDAMSCQIQGAGHYSIVGGRSSAYTTLQPPFSNFADFKTIEIFLIPKKREKNDLKVFNLMDSVISSTRSSHLQRDCCLLGARAEAPARSCDGSNANPETKLRQ